MRSFWFKSCENFVKNGTYQVLCVYIIANQTTIQAKMDTRFYFSAKSVKIYALFYLTKNMSSQTCAWQALVQSLMQVQ
jgi:hypothetical protein